MWKTGRSVQLIPMVEHYSPMIFFFLGRVRHRSYWRKSCHLLFLTGSALWMCCLRRLHSWSGGWRSSVSSWQRPQGRSRARSLASRMWTGQCGCEPVASGQDSAILTRLCLPFVLCNCVPIHDCNELAVTLVRIIFKLNVRSVWFCRDNIWLMFAQCLVL